MPSENAAVAVCDAPADAEAAISVLRSQGVDPGNISVIAADEYSGSMPAAYYLEGACLRSTTARGGCLHPFEVLPASAVLVIPGERTTLLAGPVAASVVRALNNEGLFGGLGPIAGGLYSLGIPRGVAREYELTAFQGHALVIVHGRARDVARARRILAAWREEKLQPNP